MYDSITCLIERERKKDINMVLRMLKGRNYREKIEKEREREKKKARDKMTIVKKEN